MDDRPMKLPRLLAQAVNRLAHRVGQRAAAEAHRQLTAELRRRLAQGVAPTLLAAEVEAELARYE